MDTKFAVRAVVIDKNNSTAILKVGNGRYYKIPGGHLEDGENINEALIREMAEEAGCKVKVIKELGTHEFYFKAKDRNYHSTVFLAKLIGKKGKPHFDEWETSHNFELIWIDMNKAIELFENVSPTNEHEKNIHNRDMEFLKKARDFIEK